MLSQCFIRSERCFGLLLLSMLVAGCGSTDSVVPASNAGQAEEAVAGPPAQDATAAQVPARAQTLFEQASASMAAGDYLDAELRFKEFLLQYPDYPGAHVNLAIIHANNENDAATRTAIDAALALNPNHPAALNQLGMLLRRNGNFLEAEAAYMKAVTVSPDYALAHYNLGVLNELYLQRYEAALRHFEAYQVIVGEDAQVAKWISDLKRRVAASQQTANVAE